MPSGPTKLPRSSVEPFALLLLAYALGAVLFDFAVTPWFGWGLACLGGCLAALVALGRRLALHACCALLVGFAALSIFARSLVISPAEIADSLDRTEHSARGLVAIALCTGAFLGGQPRRYLPLRAKLLTAALTIGFRLCGLLTMALRTSRLRTVAGLCLCVDAPFALATFWALSAVG